MPLHLAQIPSLPHLLDAQTQALGDQPVLLSRQQGKWTGLNWSDVRDQAARLAQGMIALGLKGGDRVVLVSENRPHWAVAHLAILWAGGVSVPAYTTNRADDHLHILNNVSARFAILSGPSLAPALFQAADKAQYRPILISLDRLEGAHHADDLIAAHPPAPCPHHLGRRDLAVIIHTSGTGGAPKGVMLSHGALLANCAGAADLIAPIRSGQERFLSFLPLSHAYEHLAGFILPLALGARIYYAEGLEQLLGNMSEVRPTIMTAVPRLYETIRAKSLNAVRRQGGIKAKLFHAALDLGMRRYQGESLSLTQRLLDRALDHLVRTKVKARFGGSLNALVSGGAPLPYDVGLFFAALGIRILQGYGQTEAAPVLTCNRPFAERVETVGPALAGVTLTIAPDGEILARGENLMQGYWNDFAATAATIRDGWLHTGDVGEIDPDGHLRITDRKKDIIVNSGGDNISPQRVEGILTLAPEIHQALVYGDRRPHLVALIVPDPDWAKGQADPHQAVAAIIDRANQNLSSIEKIRRFALCFQPFTTENGLMTPTLKLKRPAILAQWRDQLEALYGKAP